MKVHIDNAELEVGPDAGEFRQLLSGHRLTQDDIYLYSGEINGYCDRFVKKLVAGRQRRKCCTLILTTPGGDADAAYKIARLIQSVYERFTLIVPAECKSAGTLLALGASEIGMDPFGELGPLDVQVFDPDEFLNRTSGLSISQSLDLINEKAFSAWEDAFIKVRARSHGNITTGTASEIASALIVGLYSKITDKIDPSRLGELQRSIRVAVDYGLRLGAPIGCVRRLVEGYPSHSFVIDHREASELFGERVRVIDSAEAALLEVLASQTEETYGTDFVHSAVDEIAVLSIDLKLLEPGEKNDAESDSNKCHDDSRASVDGTSGTCSGNVDSPIA